MSFRGYKIVGALVAGMFLTVLFVFLSRGELGWLKAQLFPTSQKPPQDTCFNCGGFGSGCSEYDASHPFCDEEGAFKSFRECKENCDLPLRCVYCDKSNPLKSSCIKVDARDPNESCTTGGGYDYYSQCEKNCGCITEIVDGIVKECCKTPYSPYYNCTNFSNTFNQLCEQQNIDCKMIIGHCEGHVSHQFNSVQIPNGQWCLVEPQGGGLITPCSDDALVPHPEALCKIMSVGMEEDGSCACEVRPGGMPNTNPTRCALKENNFEKCEKCCRVFQDAYPVHEEEILHWFNNCYSACRNYHGSQLLHSMKQRRWLIHALRLAPLRS